MHKRLKYQKKIFKPFGEAREFARSLKLKGQMEWREYCKLGKRPTDIPSAPSNVYKKEWTSWGDWLGTGNVHARNKKWRPFKEARKFARSKKLKDKKEWFDFCRSGKKPDDIPWSPYNAIVYKKEWKDWGDFLGTGKFSSKSGKSFSEARRFARKLGLKSGKDWRELYKSGKIPARIPAKPDEVYKKEWTSWGDFLGTGNVAPKDRNILPYNEAEKIAWKICKELKINTPIEWENAWRAGKIPKNLPTQPGTYYQRKRGIAKNVENEFYTSWFKFSGTSSKWTEEMSQYTIRELAREINDPNLLLDTFMLLHTDYVLKSGKHKAEFADMITSITKGEMELSQIDFKGKVCTTIILFYMTNYIDSDFEPYSDL